MCLISTVTSLLTRDVSVTSCDVQVSDQDSVVSGQTLVDGTQLAPQQLGLMGMEALETVYSP